MRKKKNAFTLIELLAVIVILAVILVISIPRILDVIETSKKDSFKSTAQLIADSAEKKRVSDKLLGKEEEITCDKVAKISSKDYEYCIVKINEEGKATVTIKGKGKFDGMAICNASKETSEISDTCPTDDSYFIYGEAEINVIVKEVDKCKKYFVGYIGHEGAEQICNYYPEEIANQIRTNQIPSADYEKAGIIVETGETLIITGYNADGGTDVVIPSNINGKKVVEIASNAFQNKQLTSVIIPNSVTSIGDSAFWENQLTSITIPSSVTSIGDGAFLENQLTSVKIPNSVTSIGYEAFANNQLTSVTIPISVTSIGKVAFNSNQLSDEDAFIYKRNSDGSIDNTTIISYGGKNKSPIIPDSITSIGNSAFASNQLTSVTIPDSVTSIGDSAFWENQLTSITIPDSVTSIGNSAFSNNKLTTVTIPNSVTTIGWGAFRNNQLTSVTILRSFKSYGNNAFAKDESSNPNLTKIINKTGKSIDWGFIVNGISGYNFVTGTVVNSSGNVEVVNN